METWKPHQQIKNGRFTIEKVIGGGGYGVTYRAIDQREKPDKLVVIKTLNRIQQEKPDFETQQEKFVQEAFKLAKCDHPHIVKVDDVFQENGLWAIVMEYIDGDDLEVYVDRQGVLSELEALCYIDQVGQALEHVHQKGFLHRDVKPSNILLHPQTQQAVLIDFGLAREYKSGMIRSMTATRTEGYAPIEQYERRGDFGYYTDVYALAATLYTLLTARVPIPSHYRVEADVLLPSPQKYNQQISDRVNQGILQGMALEPKDRPQTVKEFRELLGLVVSSSAQQVPMKEDGSLRSSCGMDYRKLRDLLSTGKWKEADQETERVMLAVMMKREKEGWLDIEHIDNFPCEDLRTIDQLWVGYSNGRFGFSVQKQIYQGLGGTRKYDEKIWRAFGDKVGWRKGGEWLYYKDITFNLNAPSAHLPICGLGDF